MCETFAGFPFLGSAGVLGTGIWDLGSGTRGARLRRAPACLRACVLRASDIDRNVRRILIDRDNWRIDRLLTSIRDPDPALCLPGFSLCVYILHYVRGWIRAAAGPFDRVSKLDQSSYLS